MYFIRWNTKCMFCGNENGKNFTNKIPIFSNLFISLIKKIDLINR